LVHCAAQGGSVNLHPALLGFERLIQQFRYVAGIQCSVLHIPPCSWFLLSIPAECEAVSNTSADVCIGEVGSLSSDKRTHQAINKNAMFQNKLHSDPVTGAPASLSFCANTNNDGFAPKEFTLAENLFVGCWMKTAATFEDDLQLQKMGTRIAQPGESLWKLYHFH
jgi:hypothetical protein